MPGDQLVAMGLGLRQRGLEEVYRAALEVADPLSGKYGQFWSWDKLRRHTTDDAALLSTLMTLQDLRMPAKSVSADGLWAFLEAPVRQLQAVFSTRCLRYSCRRLPSFVHCASPLLPPPLQSSV